MLWRIYVSVALATFLFAVPAMWRGIRQTWGRGCPCCGESIEEWRRLAACAIIAGLFLARAAVWFVWIPGEFIWALREGLRHR
jgi:hypothetical protein